MRTLTPEKEREINVAVSRWFKSQGITQRDAAERLGVSLQCVSNELSYRHFTPRRARRWAEVFGFNEEFLLTGEGPLMNRQSDYEKVVQENDTLRDVVKVQKATIESLRRRVAELEGRGARRALMMA